MPFILESAGLISASTSAMMSGALSIGSTLLGFMQSQQQAQQAEDLAAYNAQIMRNNAQAAELAGQAEAGRLYDVNRRKIGAARATAGATGGDINMGSPVDVFTDLAGQAAMDEEIARWRGRVQGQGYRNQAEGELYKGQIAADKARSQGFGMLLSGFGRVGSGFSVAPSAYPFGGYVGYPTIGQA